MKVFLSSTVGALAFAASLAIGASGAMAETQAEIAAPVITAPGDIQWTPMIPEMGNEGPAMSIVFGEPGVIGKPFGGLFRVPAGGVSPAHIHSSEYHAVMLSGTESARIATGDKAMPIEPGATWLQPGNAEHINECLSAEECVFFVYYPNGMDYIPADH